MRLAAGWRYLVATLVLVGGCWLLPAGPVRALVQLLVAVCGLLAIATAGHRDRRHRAGWGLLALSHGLVTLIAARTGWSGSGDLVPTAAAWTGPGYLAADLSAAAGLILLRRGGRPLSSGRLLDTAVVTCSGGLLLWVAVFRPGGPGSAGTVGGWRLICLTLLLAAWVLLLTSGTGGLGRCAGIGIGVGTLGVISAVALGGALDPQDLAQTTLVLLAPVGWGFAALRGLSAPPAQDGEQDRAASPITQFTMYAALLIIPGVMALGAREGFDRVLAPLTVAAALLSVLVPARMGLAVRHLQASTRQQEAYRQDLAHQAAHDRLTDLPNRAYLRELLTALMHRAARAGEEVALLLVDLDFFKRVNEQLGHTAGDEVLRITANRMKNALRTGDIVGRNGGDEFVVLIDPVPTPTELMEIARRLLSAVSTPIATSVGPATISASIGIALARDGQTDPEQLLQDADLAAHRAKSSGRSRIEMFDAALRAELENRARLEVEIRTGLAEGHFELFYQPVFNVAGGDLHSYEALIRWRHPERGMVSPAEFIPVAEESLLICEIGRWVLRTAAAQLVSWTRKDPGGHAHVTIAVNISARHLASHTLLEDVRTALDAGGLSPTRLVLEITETVLLDEPTAHTYLQRLRDLGTRISLDDFGTGYTSIGQLQKLPIDTLKIDQSFLRNEDPASQALVQLMTTAAHAFGLDVVAEGIETREQLDRLAAIGCELAQGYFLGRPVPADQILSGRGQPDDGVTAANG